MDEKNASAEDYMTKVEEISHDLSEEEFINKAVEIIGDIEKNASNNKVLSKDCFIKIFKYTGDLAKLRTKSLKQAAQDERAVHFNVDHKKYIEAVKKTLADEEKAYEKSSEVLFDKLSISPEMFERSQQFLMQDPAL